MLPLDFPQAEEEIALHQLTPAPDADDFFRQEFVRTLFERVVEEVRVEYARTGRAVAFSLFERYDLDPSPDISYASLARESGLTQAQVTNGLAQVRRRFRERAIEVLRTLCGTDDEFRREARDLFGVDVE
jgi:hypothetical protein